MPVSTNTTTDGAQMVPHHPQAGDVCPFHNRANLSQAKLKQKPSYLCGLDTLCNRKRDGVCAFGDLWEQAITTEDDRECMRGLGRGTNFNNCEAVKQMQHRLAVKRQETVAEERLALARAEAENARANAEHEHTQAEAARETLRTHTQDAGLQQHVFQALQAGVVPLVERIGGWVFELFQAKTDGANDADLERLTLAHFAHISALPAEDIEHAHGIYTSLCAQFHVVCTKQKQLHDTLVQQQSELAQQQALLQQQSEVAMQWTTNLLHEPAILYTVTVLANSWREHAENATFATVKHKIDNTVFRHCKIEWGNNPRLRQLLKRSANHIHYDTNSFLDLVRFLGNANRHSSRACAIISQKESISPIRFFLDSSDLMIKIMLKLLYHQQSISVVNEYRTLLTILESLQDYREPDLDIFQDINL